ncbi:MAG TPA: extracellular solute-binding protein [Chloroflexota bacterium]|nr:extracellular solute-binding protein [Chloroflexota bacterium]
MRMVGAEPTRRRVLWAGSAVLPAALSVALSACGGESAGTPAAGGALTPGKVSVWGATNDGGHWEGDAAAPFRREFEEKNPGVTVEAVRIVAGGSTGFATPEEKFLAAVAGGEPPDLYSTGRAGTMAAWGLDGVVRALDERMKGSKVIKADKFLPNALEEGSWKGKTYALYHSADTRVLYWNKELYAASGLDPEKPPDTWEELATNITRTLRRDGSTISVLGYHPTIHTTGQFFWQAWHWALGGKFLSDDGAKAAFTDDTGIRALEWMQRLASIQGGMSAITPFPASVGAPNGQGSAFLVNKVAHLTETSAARVLLLNQYKDVRFGVGHMPKAATGKRTSVRGGFSLVMTSGSKRQDAAWRFMEHHFMSETLARWNDAFDRLPTTKEASVSPLYAKNDAFRKLQVEVVAYSQRVPAVHPAAFEIQPISAEIQASVLNGGASPREALEGGARKVQELLDRWKGR